MVKSCTSITIGIKVFGIPVGVVVGVVVEIIVGVIVEIVVGAIGIAIVDISLLEVFGIVVGVAMGIVVGVVVEIVVGAIGIAIVDTIINFICGFKFLCMNSSLSVIVVFFSSHQLTLFFPTN
ncbi:hypothetical protein F8M41_008433 [Gigaspora margarita]|uniref:Uncharacterized protein n=1 Tax=Gigaspora margarita TaxID=4874 RepID=A0A8H4A2B1_GIGMA|nr:hypothetical protein F8M41_008433 [Gigaspora margarita]